MLNQLDASGGNPFFDLILRNSALPSGGTVIQQIERRVPEIVEKAQLLPRPVVNGAGEPGP